MKLLQKCLCLCIITVMVLTGCQQAPVTTNTPSEGASAVSSAPASSADDVSSMPLATDEEMFSQRDYEVGYVASESTMIQLNGDSVSCNSKSVSVNGANVTITDEGTYVVTGTLSNGMIVVDADETDKLHLILQGASVTSSTSAALYVLEADKVFVTLASGTANALTNGGSFVAVDDNNIDGAVFSKQDLTFNGAGSLAVTSPGGHGIVCKDDLVFTGGSYTVTSASHGLDANDSVRITNTTFSITAGKDGIHAENADNSSLGFVYMSGGTLQADAQGDAVSAGGEMHLNNGTFTLTAGGGSENGAQEQSEGYGGYMGAPGQHGGRGDAAYTAQTATEESGTSMKGLKAGGNLQIQNGTFVIDAADDGVHSNASLTVNGGTFSIQSGDDGYHSDETLTFNGGAVDIAKCYEGLEGLHILVSAGDITLTASDDGFNAAGGTDQSGFGGHRGNDQFGGMGGPGGMSGSSNGSITITGGNITILASGDGIDSNGTLEITGGNVTVNGPTTGDTAVLDFDTTATISGGTFIGTGAMQMAQTFSESGQGVIAVSIGNQAADTLITISTNDGMSLLTYEPPLDYAILIFSSPELTKGELYTVTVGTQTGEFEAY